MNIGYRIVNRDEMTYPKNRNNKILIKRVGDEEIFNSVVNDIIISLNVRWE